MKPALNLLSDPGYKGPNDEFLKAHDHYKSGEYQDCLLACARAFESTMKVICDNKGWDYDSKRATAKNMLDILFAKELIPTFLQDHFTGLKSSLASGVPTVRNKMTGHGQGGILPKFPNTLLAKYPTKIFSKYFSY